MFGIFLAEFIVVSYHVRELPYSFGQRFRHRTVHPRTNNSRHSRTATYLGTCSEYNVKVLEKLQEIAQDFERCVKSVTGKCC